MKGLRFSGLLLAPFALSFLLFTVSPSHIMGAGMTDMPSDERGGVCQSLCPVLPAETKKEDGVLHKDIDPDFSPDLPYYTQFASLAYFAAILLTGYLLALIRKWRPPDLVILYGNYRF